MVGKAIRFCKPKFWKSAKSAPAFFILFFVLHKTTGGWMLQAAGGMVLYH
jgi:hypothetical protein